MNTQLRHTGGIIEDTVAKAVEAAITGKPGTEGEKARVEFFSSVLSRTGEKFLASPTGKDTVNRALVTVAVPAFLLGMFAFWLYSRRTSR